VAKANDAMELYSATVASMSARHGKKEKKSAQKRKDTESESDSSESAVSMHNLEQRIPKKKTVKKTARAKRLVQISQKKQQRIDAAADEEEKAFLRQVVQIEQKESKKRAKKARLSRDSDEETTSESEKTVE
jgi:hypothetical protein